MSIVSDSVTYRRLQRDPTTRIKKGVSEHIRDPYKRDLIPDKMQRGLEIDLVSNVHIPHKLPKQRR